MTSNRQPAEPFTPGPRHHEPTTEVGQSLLAHHDPLEDGQHAKPVTPPRRRKSGVTSSAVLERLAITNSLRGTTHWANMSPAAAAELTRRDVVGAGACLPMVWFCNRAVVPVVGWNQANLVQRLETGTGPVLDRAELATRLSTGRDHLAPAVLQMLAFITVTPLSVARSGLAAVSGYAPAIAAVPRPPGTSTWDAMTCDFYGFTVAEVDEDGAQVAVQGLRRAKHPLGGVPHQRRLMEEQLFDVALRAAVIPSRE